MDTAYKCRQELISQIKNNVLDRLDLTKNIINDVLPQFVEDPEAVWLIHYMNAEWLIMYPVKSSLNTEGFSLEFTVVGCDKETFDNSNELTLIFTLADLYHHKFRHVPKEELPTYLSWHYLSEKINDILKG